MGGREAFHFGSFRVHLPTLFLPIILFGTALVVVISENVEVGWLKRRSYALTSILGVLVLYYLLSDGDHGGTAVMGFGVLVSMWAASKKSYPWIFTALLFVVIVSVTYIATVYFEHQRLALAWGGDEGLLKFFDQAVNLRTARDLARAGGIFGLYDGLYVPSTVSMNIYNDLVTAYIAGFFGLLGLFVIAVAYFLFYTRIVAIVRGLAPAEAKSKPENNKMSVSLKRGTFSQTPKLQQDGSMVDGRQERMRVLKAYALGIIGAFLFQFVWVFTATLWRRLPFTGLDLQPISASVISVLSFVISLLGSVTVVRNIYLSSNEPVVTSSNLKTPKDSTRVPRRGELV